MAPSKRFATLMMRMMVGFLAAAAYGLIRISNVAYAQSAHDSGHEPAVFGHAAVYSMEAGVSNIIIIAGGAKKNFAFMVVPTTTATSGGLEEAEEAAEAAWESFASKAEEPTVLTTGESATPSETDVYKIALEDPLVLVPVELSDAGAFALFMEHDTDEVQVVVTSPSSAVLAAVVEEEGGHDEEGHDEDEHEDEDEDTSPATGAQWASGLVASALVSACSFAGLLVMMNGRVAHSIDLSHASVFSSGALLTASLLHIVPEAMEGLQVKYEDNLHGLGLFAGLSLLIGITFGVVLHALLPSSHPDSHGHAQPCHPKPTAHIAGETTCSTSTPSSEALGTRSNGATAPVEGDACGATQVNLSKVSGEALTEPSSLGSASDYGTGSSTVNLQMLIKQRSGKALLDIKDLESVCWTVIIGDFVHNIADGVAIGAAFLGCSSVVGWTVTASIILHEVPHELADFIALIKGGMSAYQAAVYNLLSALSAVGGVVFILALRDTLTPAQISFILLIGGGCFIFVALSEFIPDALKVLPGAKVEGKYGVLRSQVRKLLSFTIAALLIGIPLIFDKHCDAGHEGHNH